MISVIILSTIAYLLGSLSSALIVCKFMNLPDPRTQGSKNPGATNVLRIGGKLPALITLAGDMLKGFLPVFIGSLAGIGGFGLGIIGLVAFLGHLYPAFFDFKGGKGVATAIGAFLGLSLIVGVIVIAIWLSVASVFRYSSLAAICSALVAPVLMLFFSPGSIIPAIIISAMLLWKHKSNIEKLRGGAEDKMHF